MLSKTLQNKLRETPLFKPLSDEAFASLLARLSTKRLPGGEMLFSQGEDARSLYIVLSGRLRSWRKTDDGIVQLGEIGGGESVGEQGLLTQSERYSNVIAIRDSYLVKLTYQQFSALVAEQPAALLSLTAQVIQRLSHESEKSGRTRYMRTVALLPLTRDAPVGKLSRALADSVSWAESRRITQSDWRAHLKQYENPDKTSRWLNDQELKHDLIIYEGSSDPEWQGQCLRQADRILWVGDARLKDQLPPADLPCMANQELVLLHGDQIHNGITGHWLEHWPCEESPEHYAIRSHGSGAALSFSSEDMQRFARLLTGRALGLVLGGGGARGFAHIGMLRWLEEHGFTVDMVGGTSIGALLGAGVAAGLDSYALEAAALELFVENNYLNDYTLPLVSLLSIRRFRKALQERFSDLCIEDLPLPFYCVSANLTTASEHVHRTGLIYRAVGASMSIPGIAPPQLRDGELLVDGGVLNNLPVNVMQRMERGPVLGSDIAARSEIKAPEELSDVPGGWQQLWKRLRYGKAPDRFPSIFSLVYRSATLASMREERRLTHTLPVVRHAIGGTGTFDWQDAEMLIASGYKSTAEQAPQFLQQINS